MNFNSPFLHPAVLNSYNKVERTAMVSIAGLTDGTPNGITAMVAYPIGDDDLDTERELIPGADVWVFFEQGDMTMPVVAFYRRHGKGRAVTDVRRIRQENIELLARSTINLDAKDVINITAETINISAKMVNINADNVNITGKKTHIKASSGLTIDADIQHTGMLNTNGSIAATGTMTAIGNIKTTGTMEATQNVIGGGVSLKSHKHGGVETGGGSTGAPR